MAGFKVPAAIGGAKVEIHGEPIVMRGETWVTVVPVADDDFRIWEFSTTSGRLVRTNA